MGMKLPSASTTKDGIWLNTAQTTTGDKTFSDGGLLLSLTTAAKKLQITQSGASSGATNAPLTVQFSNAGGSLAPAGYFSSTSDTGNGVLSLVRLTGGSGTNPILYLATNGASANVITVQNAIDTSAATIFQVTGDGTLVAGPMTGAATGRTHVVRSLGTTILRIRSATGNETELAFDLNDTIQHKLSLQTTVMRFLNSGNTVISSYDQNGVWTHGNTSVTGTHLTNGNMSIRPLTNFVDLDSIIGSGQEGTHFVRNATTGSMMVMTSTNSATGNIFMAATQTGQDSGAVPILQYDARRSDGATDSAVTTRPLFRWTNFNTTVAEVAASGSHTWGIAAGGNQTFKVQSNGQTLFQLNSGAAAGCEFQFLKNTVGKWAWGVNDASGSGTDGIYLYDYINSQYTMSFSTAGQALIGRATAAATNSSHTARGAGFAVVANHASDAVAWLGMGNAGYSTTSGTGTATLTINLQDQNNGLLFLTDGGGGSACFYIGNGINQVTKLAGGANYVARTDGTSGATGFAVYKTAVNGPVKVKNNDLGAQGLSVQWMGSRITSTSIAAT